MQGEEQVTKVSLPNKVKNGWTSMPRSRRIALSVGMLATVGVMAYSLSSNNSNYVPLYTNLDYEAAGKIKTSLEESGVTDYKIGEGGSSILVPSESVDRLRMDLAVSGLTPSSGVGFELFDSTSLGMTEQERQILYQRALEGELRRSIMTLEQVSDARIHLNLSSETVFVRDPGQSSASVILDLGYGSKLTEKQIEGIVALVAGAVKNLDTKNIQIIDTAGNLLSNGISDDDLFSNSGDRVSQEAVYEKHLEDKLQAHLGKVFGYDKIAASVRVSLNQVSEEQRTEDYTDGAVVSEQTHFNRVEGSSTEVDGSSPVDNNIQNVIEGEVSDVLEDPNVLEYDNTTNYQPGVTETHTIKPPGEIETVSVSVIYSGDLNEVLQEEIQRHVASIVGIQTERGDSVSVAGIPFNLPILDEDVLTPEDESWFASLSTSEYFIYGTLLATALVGAFVVGSKRGKSKNNEVFEESLEVPIMVGENPEDEYRLAMSDDLSELTPIEQVIRQFEDDFDGSVDLLKLWLSEESNLVRKNIDDNSLDGVEKAANLLVALGKKITSDVLKKVSQDDAIKLVQVISGVKVIPYQQSAMLASEFLQLVADRRFIAQGGYDFAHDVLVDAIGVERTSEILSKFKGKPRSKRPFEVIKHMDVNQLFNVLVDEHPQTIALVLAYLPIETSAKIISILPPQLQSDVSQRIGNMNNTSSQIVEAVENVIETRLQNLMSGDMTQVGGLSTVVDILNTVDRSTLNQIIEMLQVENPKLAADVLDNLFTFEDIASLDNMSIQRVLRDVDSSVLALALKGANENIEVSITRNMSSRAAERLKEEMEYLSPVRLADVEEAQRKIIDVVRSLDESGEIQISRGGDSDVVY